MKCRHFKIKAQTRAFCKISPVVQEIITMIDKRNYTKLKSFNIAKEIFRGMKRQPTEWRKDLVIIYCQGNII